MWVGEGNNQARTLLLGMLVIGFTCVELIPRCVLLAARAPTVAHGDPGIAPLLVGLTALMAGAPVILLVVLDWFTRHVVADRPGKFEAKIPTVGKWS